MKINVGIVIAKEEAGISELEKYVKVDDVELLLLPEGYLKSEQLDEVCKLAKLYKKWIITSMADTRYEGHKYQTGIAISPEGKLVGEHKKTSITKWEEDHKFEVGDTIEAIDTPFGKIGITICFEIHFPEIARVYSLKGAKIIFNPIGTGMYNEEQFKQWSSIACARASENGVFMIGCSHFNDAIPIAYAYSPRGECLSLAKSVNKIIKVSIDLDAYQPHDFAQRRPELYKIITNPTTP